MGFSDITETYKQLETAVLALISFFGGNAGLLTKGFVKTANLIAAPFKVLTDGPSEDDAQTFIINNVCMVNGTEETKEELTPEKEIVFEIWIDSSREVPPLPLSSFRAEHVVIK